MTPRETAEDFVDPEASGFRLIWCWMLHGKHRKPTGRRAWDGWFMNREVVCEKCGLRDRDTSMV